MVWDAVIVGAGIAGLSCARRLQQTGYRVLVLEKSRGLGGRLATRRVDDQPVDHGCRFLQPTVPLIAQLIQGLEGRQVLRPWQPVCYSVANDKHLEAQLPDNFFVAPQGMTAVAKVLAEGLEIWRQRRVTGLVCKAIPEETAEQVWQLMVETSVSQPQESIQAKAIILAMPAPQALTLLQPIQLQVPSALVQSLKQVVFNPTISVMAGYETMPLPTDFVEENRGWSINGNPKTPFTWVGLDSSKRTQAALPTVVIHSSAHFAESYLQSDELDLAGQALLQQTSECLKIKLTHPLWMQIHRWRYATPVTTVPNEGLISEVPLPLACCGDWCGGTDAGAALESGWQTAEKIHRCFHSGKAASVMSDELF